MKVIFLQTYPIYHDGLSEVEWLQLENRDKWMPALTMSLGFETELWGVATASSLHHYEWSREIRVPIRLFEADSSGGRSKYHTSRELIHHAQKEKIGHLFLKGTDGGAGVHILRKLLINGNIPWSFIIGGKYLSRYNAAAHSVLCETVHQQNSLRKPGWFQKHFRKSFLNPNTAILPKSVDTTLFSPDPKATKEWDVITAGRLMDYYKDYSALKSLSKSCRVAVIGGGPAEVTLKADMPQIEWIGRVPNSEIPGYLSRAKTFFYTSLNDHFPRVIPEAAACGVPVIAFASAIAEDVLPQEIGLRLQGKKSAGNQILDLLADEQKIREMGNKARLHAETNWHKHSSLPLLKQVLEAF